MFNDIILSPEKLKSILQKFCKNETVVFTNGCFDILHTGHLRYLQEAKKQGDILIVGVNSDASVSRLKGNKRPIIKLQDRMEMLAGLKPVDFVTFFEEDTPYNLIKTLIPDILVKGGDWKAEDIVGSDIVLSNGGQVKSLNFEDGYATTNIVGEIIKKYC
jgi:rfaE bifunctional protein nucleotidyltransferase chain/domain